MLCCAESCKASACIFSEFRVFFEFAAMRRMMNSGHQCYENLCRTHAFFSEATLRMKATQQFVARWGHPSTSRRSRRRQQQAQGGRANEQWQQKRSFFFFFISYISCLQSFLAYSVVEVTSAGLESAILGSVGRCLIHWATRPLRVFVLRH